MRDKILIFPFGGNAREALVAFIATGKKQDILGFVDDDSSSWGKQICGVRVLGGRDIFKKIPEAKVLAVPGNPKEYLRRKEVIDSLGIDPSRFATAIGPNVIISADAVIGYNTLIIANSFISCNVKIGNHCVILPGAVISHNSVIEDYCMVASGVSISGGVRIGSQCYIGSKVSIRENISVGKKSLLGIGANIISSVDEAVVVVGNPARVLRKAE